MNRTQVKKFKMGLPSQYLLPTLMWGLATAFFAFQFIIRIAPGLIMPELMQKFNIDATSFGFFASLYYFGYAGIQIPMALLLDRYGARAILSICAFICGLCTILSVYTDQWIVALTCRFLIGVSSAAGFLGTSKLVTLWFPPRLYSRMIALNCTFGLLGAVYGGKPTGSLIIQFGWEPTITGIGIVGILLSFLFFSIIRNPKEKEAELPIHTSIKNTLNNIKGIITDKRIIILAFANLLMVGALEGFADVWGISYLVTSYGITKDEAAFLTSSIFLGMVVGAPILAFIAEKINSYYIVICSAGFLISFILATILFSYGSMNNILLYIFLFSIGILCSYQVLVFSMGASLVPPQKNGITIALLNCVNMLGGSFFHSIIGYSMDLFTAKDIEGIAFYGIDSYTYALSVIPIAATLGGFLVIVVGKFSSMTNVPVASCVRV